MFVYKKNLQLGDLILNLKASEINTLQLTTSIPSVLYPRFPPVIWQLSPSYFPSFGYLTSKTVRPGSQELF